MSHNDQKILPSPGKFSKALQIHTLGVPEAIQGSIKLMKRVSIDPWKCGDRNHVECLGLCHIETSMGSPAVT